MSEFGRVKRLMEIISSPAHTMQDCDRKRLALLELGDMGDISAVPVLLDYIDNPLFSITAINALGKIDFGKTGGNLPEEVIRAIKIKMEKGSPYERTCAEDTLNKIKDDKKMHCPESPEKPAPARKKIRT